MARRKKKERDDRIKSIEITNMKGGRRDLSEEQIKSAIELIELAKKDGYRITQISFF